MNPSAPKLAWLRGRKLAGIAAHPRTWPVVASRRVVPSMEFLPFLRRTGATLVLDIGGNHGQFMWAAHLARPDAAICVVEPQADAIRRAQSVARAIEAEVDFHHCLLAGSTGEERTFYVTADGDQSSMYEPLDSGVRERLVVSTRCLDELFAERVDREVGPTLLKLDVQGAELEVLKGGAAILAGIDFVLVELAVRRSYAGQPHAADVFDFLHDSGFVLLDLPSILRTVRGDLHQFDAAFERRG